MILCSRAELAGRVKLQISGGSRGTIDYPWQDNMILDQGFEQLIVGSVTPSQIAFISFGVGSSSQSVQPTDTGLIAPIAFTSNPATTTHGWSAEGGFGWSRASRSFARGAASGNISELTTGYAASNTSAMARALVRDALGNPTTITVLSDEVLTITWEWRRWWSASQPQMVEYLVDDVTKTTTVSYNQSIRTTTSGLGSGGTNPMAGSLISSSGGVFIGEFTRTFSETQGNPSVSAIDPSGNGDSGAASIYEGRVFPYDPAYATFDPPIAKTNEFRLEIRHRISLTRREP